MSYTLSGGRIDSTRTTSESVQCQVCSTNLDHLSVPQRAQHYDKHFNDEPKGTPSSSKRPFDGTRSGAASGSLPRKQGESNAPGKSKESDSPRKSSRWNDWGYHKGQDKFWYPAQSSELAPHNFTPGLIPLLKTHLNKSHAAGNTRRATLCYDRAVLVNREVWDASWGCGYRNFLMACASLMDQTSQPLYFPLLDYPLPPSVRNLQQWIEDAWDAGFDKEGKRELKKLVGTRKWIGTSDLQVAFTARGIPANLVDFDLKTNARGAEILTDWVVEYFSQPRGSVDTNKVVVNRRPKTVNDALLGASAVTVTPRMPLILQHAGHSRTIVGYEVSKTGFVNLLVFDPSKLPNKCLRQTGLDTFSSMPSRPDVIPAPRNAIASSSGKRPATPLSLQNPVPLKRSRFDNQRDHFPDQDDDDDEVVIISDSRDENLSGRGKPSPKRDKKKAEDGDKMSTPDILKFFRLDPKKLEKKKAYQVLYFPMSEPLTDLEKRVARESNVCGEKIS
ncbi:peptidase family C78-domain-containing protein [Mycena crocata]|nr:peptidase family C78-domain-containing protein [Mycena crocata]